MTEYPLEILILIIWLTHMYEYGLPHAGSGSLPDMRLLEVEHLSHDEDHEGRGVGHEKIQSTMIYIMA